MASGQVLEKFRNYYAKSEAELNRWNAAQERFVSLLGTVSNIFARLPALESTRNYGSLAELPDYPKKLIAKQLMAVEDLLADINTAIKDMGMAVQGLEKIFQNAKKSIHNDKSLTPAAKEVSAGPIPSINQCLEGLETIWRMHADEFHLEQALAAEVHYQRKPEEMKELVQTAASRPNIDTQKIKDALYIIAATGDKKS